MNHAETFLLRPRRFAAIFHSLPSRRSATELGQLRERKGRLFLIGVGGSAANCSHAVNDFRKVCGIETYSPIDNVSELTARTNDEGWDSVFAAWLDRSQLGEKDALLIYSVGGGDAERNISANIVQAIDLVKARSAKVLGSSAGTADIPPVVVLIPQVNPSWVTPLSEALQAVVWHCHPALQRRQTKW